MDSKPIIITNLTPKQKSILEIMWGIQNADDLYEYQLSLSPEDLRLSITLVELLRIEYMDQMLEETGWIEEAKTVIQKIQYPT